MSSIVRSRTTGLTQARLAQHNPGPRPSTTRGIIARYDGIAYMRPTVHTSLPRLRSKRCKPVSSASRFRHSVLSIKNANVFVLYTSRICTTTAVRTAVPRYYDGIILLLSVQHYHCPSCGLVQDTVDTNGKYHDDIPSGHSTRIIGSHGNNHTIKNVQRHEDKPNVIPDSQTVTEPIAALQLTDLQVPWLRYVTLLLR